MKKIIFIALTCLIVFLVYNEITNNELIIPNNSIRIRVIPNSNDSLDINMKNKVKDYLENDIIPLIGASQDIIEAREMIYNNLDGIDENINNIFMDNNYHQDYHINFGYNYFPKKVFQNKEYDEGYYESLVVTIGDANGDNWWCVLYPNLCLINKEDKEYKSFITEIIKKIF